MKKMKRPIWDIPNEPIYTKSKRFGWNDSECDCKKTYEIIDSDKLELRKGDVIRLPKDTRYRRYAKDSHGEYAVVLERYRITKEKPHGKFYDYGCVLMMITGKNKGNIFKASSMAIGSALKYL